MRKQFAGTVFGTTVVLFVMGAAYPASALTLDDVYYGGYNDWSGVTTTNDAIEDAHDFEIKNAVITRSGANNSVLNITINTSFAGVAGTAAAQNTTYGSLFITPGTGPLKDVNPLPWPAAGGLANTGNDVYTPNEWAYAVTTPTASNGSLTNTGGLYAVGTNVTANPYGPNPSVVQSYTTTGGTVVMSNVNGDPVTYSGSANPGFYFRQDQAVTFNPSASAIGAVIESVDPTTFNSSGNVTHLGSITYQITDNGALGDNFAIAWAITCANDVIQGWVTLGDGDCNGNCSAPPGTPLPATALLMGTVIGAGGLMSRWRRRKSKVAAAA